MTMPGAPTCVRCHADTEQPAVLCDDCRKEHDALYACPFCGGEALLTNAMGEAWVKCKICNASSGMRGNVNQAIAAWNIRAGVRARALVTALDEVVAIAAEHCDHWGLAKLQKVAIPR